MNNTDIFDHNRVILCHFDSYSTASLFARYGTSVLAPAPCRKAPAPMQHRPTSPNNMHDAVMEALIARMASPDRIDSRRWLPRMDDQRRGPHPYPSRSLYNLRCPAHGIEPHGGVFKPISDMRGTPMIELNLLRRAFDLVMSGAEASRHAAIVPRIKPISLQAEVFLHSSVFRGRIWAGRRCRNKHTDHAHPKRAYAP